MCNCFGDAMMRGSSCLSRRTANIGSRFPVRFPFRSRMFRAVCAGGRSAIRTLSNLLVLWLRVLAGDQLLPDAREDGVCAISAQGLFPRSRILIAPDESRVNASSRRCAGNHRRTPVGGLGDTTMDPEDLKKLFEERYSKGAAEAARAKAETNSQMSEQEVRAEIGRVAMRDIIVPYFREIEAAFPRGSSPSTPPRK